MATTAYATTSLSSGSGSGPAPFGQVLNGRLTTLLVPEGETLVRALEALDTGACGIAFVCDPQQRVLGAVTDGDLRRCLLAGRSLDERCLTVAMTRDFAAVGPSAGRAEVLDMMRARDIEQVPVLDAGGRLVGLHLLKELLGHNERENWAVVMAGGKGVRLRPLTEDLPKPMLSVAGRPILERLVLHLVGSGIRRIFLAVNYLSSVIEDHFGDGSQFGCRIEYLREEAPLGSGGALSLLPERPRLPLLLLNGDLVTQANLGSLLEFHDAGRFDATVGLRPYAVDIPFGVAEVCGTQLVALREKPTERWLINAGIYVLSPDAVEMIPGGEEVAITDLLQTLLTTGRNVGTHLVEDEWQDIGRREDLKRARGQL